MGRPGMNASCIVSFGCSNCKWLGERTVATDRECHEEFECPRCHTSVMVTANFNAIEKGRVKKK